jgi:DNA-binding transcriptional regulator/RsmH inhibitor MraZ
LIIKKYKTDDKGRISLSKKDRESLGSTSNVIVRKEEGILTLYSVDEWREITNKRTLNLKGLSLRRARRNLFSLSFLQRIDKQNRVIIPANLILMEEKSESK